MGPGSLSTCSALFLPQKARGAGLFFYFPFHGWGFSYHILLSSSNLTEIRMHFIDGAHDEKLLRQQGNTNWEAFQR